MDQTPTDDRKAPDPTGATKNSTLKTLLLLVFCAGAFAYAYRAIVIESRPTTGVSRQIRSSDVAERLDAARALGNFDISLVETVIGLLIEAKGDENAEVRAGIAWSLGNTVSSAMKQEKAGAASAGVQALSEMLKDKEPQVRSASADSFKRIADESAGKPFPGDATSVAGTLVGLLEDPDQQVRLFSSLCLGSFGTKLKLETPSSLLDGVAKFKEGNARAMAALALGSFKKDPAPVVQALTAALKDSDGETRSSAAASLGKFGADAAPAIPSLVALTADSFEPPPPPKFERDPRLPAIVATKADTSSDNGAPKPDPAVQALRALAKIGEAVMAKGGTVPPEVGEAASKALKSPREEVVDSAKDLLKRLRKGAGSAVPGLSALLNESLASPTPGPGSDLASLLGDVGPGSAQAADAITVLISALGAKAPETRKSALVALGRFGPEAARALPEIKKLGETEKDLTPDIKTATDRIEGKIPADAPRRKGGRRGGGAPKGA